MSLITVIVPVYKTEPYIHRCVDSILAQSYNEFDLVLVDDGSPDNSGAICDEYAKRDSRVIVIHKDNGGHSDSRNAGIDWCINNSDSEWITFIDSDDFVHPQYLSVLLTLCNEYSVDISSCGCIKFEDETTIDEDSIIIDKEYGSTNDLALKFHDFCKFNVSIMCGRLYRKELFSNVRFPKGRYFEDEFIIYKLLFDSERIAITTAGLYYYYQNNAGVMASQLSPERMNDQLDAVSEQIDYFIVKKFRKLFEIKFYYYCYLVEKYKHKYKSDNYRDYLCTHMEKISHIMKEHKDYLPSVLLKYGYKKWISGKAMRQYGFAKDLSLVRAEKGVIYSLLWAIKNYHKNKGKYKINAFLDD